MEPRSLEPSDNNILSLYRSVAFVDLTHESRNRAFARTKFDHAAFAVSGLLLAAKLRAEAAPFNTPSPAKPASANAQLVSG